MAGLEEEMITNLVNQGASDNDILAMRDAVRSNMKLMAQAGKSDQEIVNTVRKTSFNGKPIFGQTPAAPAPSEPGALAKAGQAVGKSFTETKNLVAPATPESSIVGKIARPVARAGLDVMGKVFAPAAGIGSLAESGTVAGLNALGVNQDMSPAELEQMRQFAPGAYDLYKQAQPGYAQKGVNAVGQAANLATQAMLPTGVATGGLSTVLGKAGKLAGDLAQSIPIAKAIKAQGGPQQAITNVATTLAQPATGPALEQTGKLVQGTQQAASQFARGAASQGYEQAIKAFPEGASVTSDFAKSIADLKPSLSAAQTPASRKLGQLAGDVADGGMPAVKIGRGAQPTKYSDLSPDLQERVMKALGGVGDASTMDINTLDSVKKTLNNMTRQARTDQDRRLLANAQNALEADKMKFGQQYPEQMKAYQQADQFYKNEVAQFHAKGAPLRDLVQPDKELVPASTIVDNFRKKPVEDIRNVMAGLKQAPMGDQTVKTLGDSVVGSIMDESMDKVSGIFQPKKFIDTVRDRDVQHKLQVLLPKDKYDALQNFTDKTAELLSMSGNKAFENRNNPMLRTMGWFHLIRGTQEAIIGLPMALYQFSAAGTMLMMPKLAGMLAQSRATAPLMAELMTGVTKMKNLDRVRQVLGKTADSMGAVQIPNAVAQGANGNY